MSCFRTQQVCLLVYFPHHLFLLSANQGSCEYDFLKSFRMTRLGNDKSQVCRLRNGRSNYYAIASVSSLLICLKSQADCPGLFNGRGDGICNLIDEVVNESFFHSSITR